MRRGGAGLEGAQRLEFRRRRRRAGFELGQDGGPENPTKLYGEVGLAVGYGLGTGRQVDPPLDNAQITDKGPLFQVAFGVDYRMSRVVSIGVTLPVTFAYLYKQGSVVTDTTRWYQSLHGDAFVHLRFHIEAK